VNGPVKVSEDCLKLTSYFGERQRTEGRFTADALLDLYGQHRIATSILLRGTEGFGASHRPRTDRSLSLSEDLPLIAVAVDTRSRIEEVLGPTTRLIRTGLVTLERARLLTGATFPSEDPRAEPHAELPEAIHEAVHEETKLTIYLGRQERVYRVPAFVAVCDLLHRRGIAGATALLGVDGTAHGDRERAAFFGRNTATPMMVIAVGSGRRITRVLPELGGLLRRPLLTLERVRICKRDGELLCRPSVLPAADETGVPSGTSSWSTRPRPRCTTASRSTARSSAGSARPGSAVRPRSAASGASTATTRPTATGSSRSAGTSRSSRS